MADMIETNSYAVANAYKKLDIDDHAVSDEQVVVAYHATASLYFDHSQQEEALETIAAARHSRFLHFALAIRDHLDDENIAILKGMAPDRSTVANQLTVQPTITANSSPDTVVESAADEKMDIESSVDSIDTPDDSSLESESHAGATHDYGLPRLETPDPEGSYIPCSSDQSSGESDREDEPDELLWWDQANEVWRCWNCEQEFVEGKCPNGHCAFCRNCEWQFAGEDCPRCPKTCQGCGQDKIDGECAECVLSEESEKEKEGMALDDYDKVWRCTICMVEVQADNKDIAYCGCYDPEGRKLYFDLSEHPDYYPADSCSSEDESTDEEPDTEDEAMIDDEPIPMERSPFSKSDDPIEGEADTE